METIIRKWGNSPAVRLPQSVMKAAHFTLEQPIRVSAEEGRIIIEPLEKVEYSLAELVAGITPRNRHNEVSFGAPAGKEAL